MSNIGNINAQLELSDVGIGLRKVSQIVKVADFTDGDGTSGTLNLNKKIPAGSFVIGSKVTVETGFSGDTTCVLDIGNSDDADAYSYTTHNIFASANNLVEGADSSTGGTTGEGLKAVPTATTVLLTATSGSDWGLVTAGKMLVEVLYISTNVELIDGHAKL
jgi:hypothetical protein